jgi:hypothetical protein
MAPVHGLFDAIWSASCRKIARRCRKNALFRDKLSSYSSPLGVAASKRVGRGSGVKPHSIWRCLA